MSGSILDNYPLKMKIVEEVIQEMQVPVVLLNVTRLTNFRKDGHPSVYGKNVTDGRKVSTKRQDCSHWCLPGVPDTWNELIYATLVARQTVSMNHWHPFALHLDFWFEEIKQEILSHGLEHYQSDDKLSWSFAIPFNRLSQLLVIVILSEHCYT